MSIVVTLRDVVVFFFFFFLCQMAYGAEIPPDLYAKAKSMENLLDPVKRRPKHHETWVVPDLHGSLEGALVPLIWSGVVKWDRKTPFILYDRKLQKVSENQVVTDSSIWILNLKWNRTKNRILFLGDYLDRGPYSLELLYSLIHVAELQKKALPEKRNFILLLGNHEWDLLRSSSKPHIKDVLLTKARKKERKWAASLLSSSLFDMYYYRHQVLYSHSFLSKEFLDHFQIKDYFSFAKNKKDKSFSHPSSPIWSRLSNATPVENLLMITGHNKTTLFHDEKGLYKNLYLMDHDILHKGPMWGIVYSKKGLLKKSIRVGAYFLSTGECTNLEDIQEKADKGTLK